MLYQCQCIISINIEMFDILAHMFNAIVLGCNCSKMQKKKSHTTLG